MEACHCLHRRPAAHFLTENLQMAQECMIHFVEFDRTTLKNLREKAAPIRLNNRTIQKNKLSGKLEVTLKGYTW